MMRVEVTGARPSDPITTVLRLIVRAHDDLASFWSNPRGWAPDEAAAIFDRCRLDRLAQLARCLRYWIEEGAPEEAEGRLVLARANLGALVEGAMQLGLTVFHADYSRSTRAPRSKGVVTEAPDLMLNTLRIFYRDEFWRLAESARWDKWAESVQQRRNGVHAFAERNLGSHTDFLSDVRTYLEFLAAINNRLPYPD